MKLYKYFNLSFLDIAAKINIKIIFLFLYPYIIQRFSNYKLQGEVFKRFVNITATLDLPYLKELALNMACSLESASNKDSLPVQESIYENTIRFKELVETYLSDDYINERFDKIQKQAKDQVFSLSIIEFHIHIHFHFYSNLLPQISRALYIE